MAARTPVPHLNYVSGAGPLSFSAEYLVVEAFQYGETNIWPAAIALTADARSLAILFLNT